MSLPSWERGLKSLADVENVNIYEVAPFMGAWIEIFVIRRRLVFVRVAPFMGAWIEIVSSCCFYNVDFVAPFMGAWIEIFAF